MCDINYDIKKICIPVKIQTEYQTFLYVKAYSQGYGRDKPATESGVIRKTTTKYIPKFTIPRVCCVYICAHRVRV